MGRASIEKTINGFDKSTIQEVFIATERDQARGLIQQGGQVEAVNGIEEKKRAHTLI